MRILIDGGTISGPEEQLADRYIARIPAPWKTEILSRRKATVPKAGESYALLDVCGKQYSTEKFADWLWNRDKNITFVIGGSHGFISDWQADIPRISLSAMTFPHRLAVALFAEQLYRAYTYKVGHPYHHQD